MNVPKHRHSEWNAPLVPRGDRADANVCFGPDTVDLVGDLAAFAPVSGRCRGRRDRERRRRTRL